MFWPNGPFNRALSYCPAVCRQRHSYHYSPHTAKLYSLTAHLMQLQLSSSTSHATFLSIIQLCENRVFVSLTESRIHPLCPTSYTSRPHFLYLSPQPQPLLPHPPNTSAKNQNAGTRATINWASAAPYRCHPRRDFRRPRARDYRRLRCILASVLLGTRPRLLL